jgi:hypothetical protein
MTPQNNPRITNGKYWLKKGINFVQNLPWRKLGENIVFLTKHSFKIMQGGANFVKNLPWIRLGEKIHSFGNAIFVKLPAKIPWGMIVYFSLIFVAFYKLYPSGDSGSAGEWPTTFFVAIGLVVGVILLFFAIKAYKKRKTEKVKKETEKDKPKETIKKVAPKYTFWNDPKTYFAILVGYFFFSMAIANGFFSGPIVNVHTLIPPAEGMLYVPWFGLLVNVIICVFVFLLFVSVEEMVSLTGILAIWPILGILGFCNDWFMPFDAPHTVIYPALKWAGMAKWTFYPNPQWSTGWICFWFVFLFFGLPYFAEKTWNTVEIKHKILIGGMVITVWCLSFGQQLLIFWLRSIGFH